MGIKGSVSNKKKGKKDKTPQHSTTSHGSSQPGRKWVNPTMVEHRVFVPTQRPSRDVRKVLNAIGHNVTSRWKRLVHKDPNNYFPLRTQDIQNYFMEFQHGVLNSAVQEH